jgi:hypothetical protein
MVTVTYYFNSYDNTIDVWETNPELMVDSDEDTPARTTVDNDTETLNHTTCDGTNLGTITKVELRWKGYTTGGSISMFLTPIFTGGSGDPHSTPFETENVWCDPIDITSDTNNPGTWGWGDVKVLNCLVAASAKLGSDTIFCGKVEIIVTYDLVGADHIHLTGPSTVVAGVESTNFTITVHDSSNSPVNVDGDTVFSITSNTSGSPTYNPTSPITILDGNSTKTFTYTDTDAGEWTITVTWVSGDVGLTDDTDNSVITVTAAPIVIPIHLHVNPIQGKYVKTNLNPGKTIIITR